MSTPTDPDRQVRVLVLAFVLSGIILIGARED